MLVFLDAVHRRAGQYIISNRRVVMRRCAMMTALMRRCVMMTAQ